MFNFGNFLTKNAITFDQKDIERKKRYLVCINFFCCASNAAIKNVKIARKKINFFPKIFSINRHLEKKIQIFRKHKVYFQILEVLPVILTTYLPVSVFSNIVLNSRKIMKIMSTLYLRPPLRPNHDPQSKNFFHHTVLNYFLGKVLNPQ